MAERKFKLYDRVVIHDSFATKHNDCVGEIFDFTYVNGKYYYNIKLEDGRLSLGTPEHMIKLTMDLINGKTMYCPECGKSFAQYDGKVNGKTAHVTTYCKDCNKHYHWVAYISKNTKEHTVGMFSEYYKAD